MWVYRVLDEIKLDQDKHIEYWTFFIVVH